MLTPYLEAKYGWSLHYTPSQVVEAIRSESLSSSYVPYALAMFCGASDFAAHFAGRGEQFDYTAMHAETQRFGTGYRTEAGWIRVRERNPEALEEMGSCPEISDDPGPDFHGDAGGHHG